MTRRSLALPVLLPLAPVLTEHRKLAGTPRVCAGHLLALAAVLLVGSSIAAEAIAGPAPLSVVATLIKWTPLIAQGFMINIGISIAAMGLGTAMGLLLGVCLVSLLPPVRWNAWLVTQFFRNAPWLVLLFYCMLLMPFDLRLGPVVIPLPDWLKATLGLAVAVMANMAEIVRGAIQSVPSGQWEASEALAFSRTRTLWRIILPQCIKRMLPPWMNLYALLLVSTPLCSIVGVNEALTLTADALVAESRQELLLPMYSYLLLWFFLACYPIARATIALERRFSIAA